MRLLSRFLDSMAGRIFALLLVGIVVSASLALILADAKRRADIDRLRLDQVAERTQSLVALLGRTPEPARTRLALEGVRGVRATKAQPAGPRDEVLTRLLTSRLGPGAAAEARDVDLRACLAPSLASSLAEPSRDNMLPPPQCWLVTTRLPDGSAVRLAVDAPPRLRGVSPGVDPIYLGLLAVAALAMAFAVAQIAAEPLKAFARAAAELGRNLDRPPVNPKGPREVREAAAAFSSMQADLKRHVGERTQILAAIAHDLQTPLTRMRLRLEKVSDPALRDSLVGDLTAMQGLVREGLELARTERAVEPVVRLDLGSLLESLVEDAQDAGHPVTLGDTVSGDIPARPQALRRCLENLIDNAVKYGGCAEISAVRETGSVAVRIRDHGPGVPEDRIDSLFDPFVRLEGSRSRETGGSGLGLSIARRLAEQNGAELHLHNDPDGGMEATLRLPAPPGDWRAPGWS